MLFFLAAAEISPKTHTLADTAEELFHAFKGKELYTGTSLAVFLLAVILAFIIIVRGWGIGYRLALIPLAFVPFLITLIGVIWKFASLPYVRYQPEVESSDVIFRENYRYAGDILLLIPFGTSLSILLLLLSFITLIQARNGQLAYILPGHPADRS